MKRMCLRTMHGECGPQWLGFVMIGVESGITIGIGAGIGIGIGMGIIIGTEIGDHGPPQLRSGLLISYGVPRLHS